MKSKLEDEIDALFTLPLAEFTGVRNTLAARLKKEKRPDEADRVEVTGKASGFGMGSEPALLEPSRSIRAVDRDGETISYGPGVSFGGEGGEHARFARGAPPGTR